MKRYLVTANIVYQAKTAVDADSPEEAAEIALQRSRSNIMTKGFVCEYAEANGEVDTIVKIEEL